MQASRHVLGEALALVFCLSAAEPTEAPAPERFAGEIRASRTWDRRNARPADMVRSPGSSTSRRWRTAESLPDPPVVKRGFGGAQFPDLLRYRDEVLPGCPPPSCIVLHYGDNRGFTRASIGYGVLSRQAKPGKGEAKDLNDPRQNLL
jgi:hypothetical protein